MTARTMRTAATGLLGAILLAAPAAAQSTTAPNESTPEEMRATDALNAQAAKEASEIVRMNEENERAFLRARQAYAQKLQDHRAKLEDLEQAKAAYEKALQEYSAGAAAYAAARELAPAPPPNP